MGERGMGEGREQGRPPQAKACPSPRTIFLAPALSFSRFQRLIFCIIYLVFQVTVNI